MSHGHIVSVTFWYLSFLLCLGLGVLCHKNDQDWEDHASVPFHGDSFVNGHSEDTTSGSHQTQPVHQIDQISTQESEESLRKEYIKVQILQKLGLSEKPHVDLAHKLSRDLVLETLRRTESLDLSSSATSTSSSHNHAVRINASRNVSAEDDGGANYAKTSEIISFPDKGPILNGHTLLSFSYAGSNAYGMGVRIKKAHFWVKMDYRSSIGRHFGHLLHPRGITLYVFQVQGNFSHLPIHKLKSLHLTSQNVSLDLVVSRTISADALDWQKLDVTSLVHKWYGRQSRHRIRHQSHHQSHRDKLTLLVDCAGCGQSVHPVIFSSSDSEESSSSALASLNELNDNDDVSLTKEHDEELDDRNQNQHQNHSRGDRISDSTVSHRPPESEIPFLVLETESAPNFKRSRRRAFECSARMKHCCKQRFYISFRDLGWDDWIIAPRGYYANYCRGHCGGVHRTPDTFLNYHTHVLEEYRRTPAGQVNLSGITPCCAPTKFASMSLIYFGPDLNIIKRDLPKMIVEECGCP